MFSITSKKKATQQTQEVPVQQLRQEALPPLPEPSYEPETIEDMYDEEQHTGERTLLSTFSSLREILEGDYIATIHVTEDNIQIISTQKVAK